MAQFRSYPLHFEDAKTSHKCVELEDKIIIFIQRHSNRHFHDVFDHFHMAVFGFISWATAMHSALLGKLFD
jgi:hypothetical protein